MKEESPTITWNDFSKIDIRIGTVISAAVFEEAKKPAYKLSINFGALGIRKTSAQIAKNYTPESLLGKQVIAVINFPPKQIANIMSECLVLGVVGDDNDVVLIQPGRKMENGLKIG